jgi:uncharacterized protein (DUF1800 family)
MLANVFHAGTHFGLGIKPGEDRLIGSDPAGWLMEQLINPVVPPEVQIRHHPDSTLLRRVREREIYNQESGARFLAHVRTTQPFVERLVMFWSNHFTVSVQNWTMSSLANAYEVEAIRPHVGGYFRDMLIAVMRHPAMLLYLDNNSSSVRGINENLAREILELHTLGINGGYTQDDVIALAKILTGWTVKRNKRELINIYNFVGDDHVPGEKTLLGKVFPEDGENEGIQALTWLAARPSTAQHIATKLARHFIADMPPPEVVELIMQAYLKSDGHLPTVIETMLGCQEAWQPLTKFKTPYEYAVSSYRLTATEPAAAEAVSSLRMLNYAPFGAVSPAGFSDTADGWVSSSAIIARIQWAHQLANHLPATTDPMQLAVAGLQPVLSPSTRSAIEWAPTNADGVALVLSSPEFLRR